LNYFSFKESRKIEIITTKEFMEVDLINEKLKISKLNKIIVKKFNKISPIQRMYLQLEDIQKKRPKHACSYKDGVRVLENLGV